MKSNVLVTHYEYDGVIHVKACGNKRIDEYTMSASVPDDVLTMAKDSASSIVNLGECAHYWASKGLQDDLNRR